MDGAKGRVGELSEPSAVRSLTIDDVRLTYVVDGVLRVDSATFFPAIPPRYWTDHPGETDSSGRVVMAVGGLLVERAGHRLLIDAGWGPVVEDTPFGPVDSGRLPSVLSTLGVGANDIDTVAVTHVHVDHTGWLFRPGPQGPVAQFPRAALRVAALELDALRAGHLHAGVPDRQEIVEPLLAAALPLADGDEIAPGVTALVAPGHSPGHTSYVVRSSRGRRIIVLGDTFHTLAQLREPSWPSLPDFDSSAVPAARARLIEQLMEPGTVGFAFHFGDQVFGRVVEEATGIRSWEPIVAQVVA